MQRLCEHFESPTRWSTLSTVGVSLSFPKLHTPGPLPGPPLQWSLTSLDWRMVRSGIHTVPTIVSQMRPLFHTSTVRPRSRRLISLCAQGWGRQGSREEKRQA